MATAKLWWNGSAWGTSDTTCATKTSKGTEAGARPGIRGSIKLVAYDDGTVKLYASLVPDGISGSGNTLGGTFTISFAGTTITVTNGSSKSGDTRYTWSGDISAETGTISYNTGSQNISCVYYIDGAQYCSPLSFNGSVSVGSSPFRTITFNANGGSDAPSAQTVCVNASAVLTSAVPTRTGYTFLGWSTSSTATTATYTAGGTITVSGDTTLYAVWQANSFSLSITKPATASVTILKNGEAFSGTTVNYNDVLTITATPSAGYRIVTLTVNGSDFVSGSTHTVTGAVAIEVTTIAQSSTIATFDNTVNTLDTFNLTVNRYSTSHYNKLRYYDSNDTLLYTSDVFTEGTSLVIPQSWFTNFGAVTSITITAILTTYTEPECINITGVTDTCYFTVTADASMKPVLATGFVTLSEYNTGTGVANLSNPGYVKGYSKVQAVFDTTKITHAVGASAGSYSIAVLGTTSPSSSTTIVSSNILSAAGSVTVTCTVTDSRGRSTSATISITVNDYAYPAIGSLNCYRCDSLGYEDENENYMAVTAGCTFTTISDNAITINAQVKPTGGSYTDYGTIPNAIKTVIGGTFVPDTSYFLKVTVTDTVGNSTYTEMSMPRRSWLFHMRQSLGGPGAAFGKVTENDYALQLASGWKFMMGNTQMTESELSDILNGGGGGAKIHIGPNAPTDPDVNIWLDTDEPGMSAVSSVNAKTGTVVLDALDVGATALELLWENASPTANFAAQTISLDLSAYEFVRICFIWYKNETPNRVVWQDFKIGELGRAFRCEALSKTTYMDTRDISPTSTGIVFSDNLEGSNNANTAAANTNLIPKYIYGIKGVITT